MRMLAITLLCSAVAAASPPSRCADYQVAVTNSMGHPIEVGYARADSANALHDLGAIASGTRTVFSIPTTAGSAVTLSAEGIDGTPMGTRAVTLKPDSLVEVRF